MDLMTIATTLFHWCVPAAAAGFVLILAGYAIYRVLRKRFPSMRPLSTRQTVSLILLVLWMLLTLGLTSASRGANYTGQVNLDLFSGYRSAWNNWSLREAQLIVFNMLLFAPLGFLLPMIWKRAESFRATLLISLGATLLLETMQLLTGTGIFELDDLLHNLIGSLFGYFLATLLLSALRERKIRAISVVRMMLIPCAAGAILGGAICAYAIQPYGNMPICPAIRQNLSHVEVLLETDLESTEKTMPVYKNMRAGDANYIRQVMNCVIPN